MEQMRNEDRPFFSIVMPVYKAEQYIKKAVKSIQEQTFSDWELIIINDCSPDQSGKIAEILASEDERIRVLHHEKNQGVSKARNNGIQLACGRYLWFVDADDSADKRLLEKVYRSLQKHPAQMVLFGLIEEYYDQENKFSYSHEVSHRECYFMRQEELRKEMIYLEQETLYGYPWNKIYDLEYLKQLRLQFLDYTEAKFIEDITFNIGYCMDIETMNILSDCLYHYAKRLQDNLTNEFVPEYFKFHKKRIELLFDQYKYWKLDTLDVRAILGGLYARYILSAMQRNCDKRSKMSHIERYRWCRGLFQQEMFNELITVARAKDSRALSILLFFLKWKRTMICLVMARVVYLIKNKLPMLYTKVKSER